MLSRTFKLSLIGALTICCSSEHSEKDEKDMGLNRPERISSDIPEVANQYGRMVGDWKCSVKSFNNDSITGESTASWKFDYALNGHAVQDYWINPAEKDSASQSQSIGTNLRVYNPDKGYWECVWAENQGKSISGIWFSEMNSENELLLYDESGDWVITFFDIQNNHFSWMWEILNPKGCLEKRVTIDAKKIES